MYRNIVILVAITIFFVPAHYLSAQTDKGTINVGISTGLGGAFGESVGESNVLGLGVSSVNGGRSTVFGLSPNIGYFIEDNLMIAAQLRIRISSADDFLDNSIRLGPSVRWYSGEEKLRATMEMGIAIGSSKYGNSRQTLVGFSGGPGIAWLISERVSVDIQAIAEYDSHKFKSESERTATHRFGFRAGIGIFL